jgi:hypothetical protein
MPFSQSLLTFYQQLYGCTCCSGATSNDGVRPFVTSGPGQTIPVSHFGRIETAKIWLIPTNPKGDRQDSNVGFRPSGFLDRATLTQQQSQQTFDHFSGYFQRPTTHAYFSIWIQMLEGMEVGGVPQSWFVSDDEHGGICAVDLVKCPTLKDWGGFVRANKPDKQLIYLNCFEDAGPGRFLKRQIQLHQPTVLIFADTGSYFSENRRHNKDHALFNLWPSSVTDHRTGVWTFGTPPILSIGLGSVRNIRAASPTVYKEIRDTIQAIIRAGEARSIASASIGSTAPPIRPMNT